MESAPRGVPYGRPVSCSGPFRRPLRRKCECRSPSSLDEALEIALDNNPTMQATRNDVNVANWNLTAAYGSWMPTASLNSGVTWQGAGEQRFGSITAQQLGFQDQPSFLLSSYSANAGFSINGRMLMAPGQASRNRDATRAQVRSQEATLRLNVTRAYLDVLRQTEAPASRRNRNSTGRSSTCALPRAASRCWDPAPRSTCSRPRSTSAAPRSRCSSRRRGCGPRSIRLLQQMGADLSAEPVLTTTFAVTEPTWNAEDLYGTAMDRNPGLQALRAQERSARYGVNMARSSYFPSVSMSAGISGFTRQASSTAAQEAQAIAAGVGRVQQCLATNELLSALPSPPPSAELLAPGNPAIGADLDPGTEQRAFPFDFTNSPPSASLSVSIPIFQGLSRQREVEGARAQLLDSRYRVSEQRLALRADIEAQTATVRTAYATALIEERNQALVDEQLRLAQERYRQRPLQLHRPGRGRDAQGTVPIARESSRFSPITMRSPTSKQWSAPH